MRKASLLLALVLFSCLLAPAAMAATSGSCGTNITWRLDTSTRTLTITCNGEGQMNDYKNYDSAPWHSQWKNIDHVVMTGYITYIGKNNFFDLEADFVLPDTIKRIGKDGLAHCTIYSINMPALLETIDESAFEFSVFKQGITIPNGVEEIPYRAFKSCTLPSITLPSTLKYIRDNAFHLCVGLTELELPEGLTYIGYGAFVGCSSLKEITIPSTLNNYDPNYFFDYCNSLEAIHVSPDNEILTDVDGVLFDKPVTNLILYPTAKQAEHFDVPSSVTVLNPATFSQNEYLKSVSLPDGIIVLPRSAFLGCTQLNHVDLPAGLTEIGNYAFEECTALTEMTIPYGVTTLGNTVFSKSGLQRLTIPETVTTFGDRIFDLCPDGLTLCVAAGSPAHDYAVENGFAVEFLSPFDHADLILPDDLTTIEDEAFMGTDAAIVHIPASVTEIGSRAFADCPNLRHINLPVGATLADDAFDGCGTVYLYAPAETYATAHDNVTFVPLEP